jgi:hypothetical protein
MSQTFLSGCLEINSDDEVERAVAFAFVEALRRMTRHYIAALSKDEKIVIPETMVVDVFQAKFDAQVQITCEEA